MSDLDEVAAKIAKLTASDPVPGRHLVRGIPRRVLLKVEELDDSSGSFGQFVDELYCGWIKARQAEGATPDETASRLLAWMDDDEYGFCYHLEKDAREGLQQGQPRRLRERRSERGSTPQPRPPRRRMAPSRIRPTTSVAAGARSCAPSTRPRRTSRRMSRSPRRRASRPRIAMRSPRCSSARRKPEEALAWVERGIDLDKKTPHGSMAGHDLAKLKRELLTKLGRGNEALDAAWADYRKHPSKYRYDDLMKFVPKAERAEWHEKAIDAAKGADLHSAIDLLVATKEMDRLADLVHQASDHALEEPEPLHHRTRRPRSSRRPTPTSRLGCGARRGCGSSTPRRASTTTPRCPTSRAPSAASSAPGSMRSGRRQ